MNTTTYPQTSDLTRLDSVVESIGRQIQAEFDKMSATGEDEPSPRVNELLRDFKTLNGRAALERFVTYSPERRVLEKLAEEATFEGLLAVGLSAHTVREAAGEALAAIDFAIAMIRGISVPKPTKRPRRSRRPVRRDQSLPKH